MDHGEDQNDGTGNPPSNSKRRNEEDRIDGAENPPLVFQRRNEETGEAEQDSVLRYRTRQELFASDESVENVSSDASSHDATTQNIDHAMNNPSFSKHLDSIPGFDNCNEKVSCLFDIDRQSQQQESEELTTKLNKIILNDKSCKCLNSNENDSEKPGHSREIVNVSDYSMSQENTRSPVQSERSSNPESSGYRTQNLESSTERKEISSMTPQASTSQNSNFSSHLANEESCDWFSMRSPDAGTQSILSLYIKSEDMNLENAHFETPLDIFWRNVARSLEHSNTLSHKIHSAQECQRSNSCLSHNRSGNTSDTSSSPTSDILDLEDGLPSWEKPSTSTHDIFSRQYSNACTSSSSKIRKKNASSLSNLPSTSKITPQDTPPRLSEYPTHASKSARQLIFSDSDNSSDDSKEKIPTGKVNLVRKYSETKEPRKKRKLSHLSKLSENHSTLSKTDNDENVSENINFPPSSKNSDEKSSNPRESKSVSSVLCSSETMKSEISKAHQSSRKRLISDAKTSDSDESNVKSKQNKKLKECDSSDEEIS